MHHLRRENGKERSERKNKDLQDITDWYQTNVIELINEQVAWKHIYAITENTRIHDSGT